MTDTQNIPELISVRWWKKTQQHKSKQSLKIADLISSSILFNPLTTATSELDHIKSAVLKKKNNLSRRPTQASPKIWSPKHPGFVEQISLSGRGLWHFLLELLSELLGCYLGYEPRATAWYVAINVWTKCFPPWICFEKTWTNPKSQSSNVIQNCQSIWGWGEYRKGQTNEIIRTITILSLKHYQLSILYRTSWAESWIGPGHGLLAYAGYLNIT